MSDRYVVTGGAGFIGSHIVEALVQRGDQVTVLDDFSSGLRSNLEPVLSQITLVEGDLRDRDAVQRAMQGARYVLHQGALRSVPKSMEHPADYHAVNVTGTLNVLLAARDAGVTRVVLASSSSVYGEGHELPQREDVAPRPISPYAATKWMGEQYCQLFSKAYGLDTVSLRYFNVFGPRQSLENEYAVVIPKFTVSLLNHEPPPVHGDGLQSRDFTYIDNVVAANLRACTAQRTQGEAVNIACGERYTLLDVVTALNGILKTSIAPIHGAPRAGDVRHTLADIGRARDLLGYTPNITFHDGLQRTVTWFAQQRQLSRS